MQEALFPQGGCRWHLQGLLGERGGRALLSASSIN